MWWMGVALQPAQHLALNNCQLHSTENPRFHHLCAVLAERATLGLCSGEVHRRNVSDSSSRDARAREFLERDVHGAEKKYKLIYIIFDQKRGSCQRCYSAGSLDA